MNQLLCPQDSKMGFGTTIILSIPFQIPQMGGMLFFFNGKLNTFKER